MNAPSFLLGCVGYVHEKSGVAKLVPLVDFGPEGRPAARRINPAEQRDLFPNTGQVAWYSAPDAAVKDSLWTFRAAETPTFDATKPSHDRMAVQGEGAPATEILDVRQLADATRLREALAVEGLTLYYTPCTRVYLWVTEELWLGPVRLIRSPEDAYRWRLEPAALQRPVPTARAVPEAVGTATAEGTERLFLAPWARPRAGTSGYDWSGDDEVLKRVLRWVVKRSPDFARQLELTRAVVDHAADVVLRREAGAADADLRGDRLGRARRLLDAVEAREELADTLIDSLVKLPRFQREVAARADAEVAARVDAALADVASRVAEGEQQVAAAQAEFRALGEQRDALVVEVDGFAAIRDEEREHHHAAQAALRADIETLTAQREHAEQDLAAHLRALVARPPAELLAQASVLRLVLAVGAPQAGPSGMEAAPVTGPAGDALAMASFGDPTSKDGVPAGMAQHGNRPDGEVDAHAGTGLAAGAGGNGTEVPTVVARSMAPGRSANGHPAGGVHWHRVEGHLGNGDVTNGHVGTAAGSVVVGEPELLAGAVVRPFASAWGTGAAPEPVSEPKVLERGLRAAAARARFDHCAGFALHAACIAGIFPVLSGPRALDLAEAYADAVCGGRLLWIPVSPATIDAADLFGREDVRGHFVPQPGGLLDTLLDAEGRDELLLVVLDGVTRAPVDTYLAPLLECYRTRFRGPRARAFPLRAGHRADAADPYARLDRVAWPRNVLLAGTWAEGPAALPPSAAFWSHAALLNLDLYPPPAGAASGTRDENARPARAVPLATWDIWCRDAETADVQAYQGLRSDLVARLDEHDPDGALARTDAAGERLFAAALRWHPGIDADGACEEVVVARLIPEAIAAGALAPLRAALAAEGLWTDELANVAAAVERLCR